MKSFKLSNMPYASAQKLVDSDNTVYLKSYSTIVVKITEDGWLSCTGTYSQTTRKHISAFMREMNIQFPSGDYANYYTCKDAYENRYSVNLYTGEIIDL